MSPPRKNQGGGDAVLTSVAAKAPPRPFPEQFRREFAGRFRFELNNDNTTIRVIGYFGDLGCQKTWAVPFRAGWETEAAAAIRAWRAMRAAA